MSTAKLPRVQLLSSRDCPNAEQTRHRLREALASEGLPPIFEEVSLDEESTPASLRNWGSPTVLVDGEDLAGGPGVSGAACRIYAGTSLAGVPPETLMRAAIQRATVRRRRFRGDEMAPRVMNEKDKYIATGSALGAVGAAGVATLAGLCCAGPSVVALLGASGAVAAAGLAPYRPYFLLGAFALLGFGFWRSYRPVSAESGSCSIRSGKAVRTVLWLSLATTIVSVLVPMWLA